MTIPYTLGTACQSTRSHTTNLPSLSTFPALVALSSSFVPKQAEMHQNPPRSADTYS